MALGDSYGTVPLLKARIGIPTADTAEDTDLTTKLAVASRGVDGICHRQFNLDSSATARVYDPVSDWLVCVDDFYTTTGLIVATDEDGDGVFETTWTSADYEVRPLNGIVDAELGWPFYEIRSINRCWPWRSGRASVQVTAKWGWSAVPSPVTEATLILAEEIYKLKDSPFGTGGYGSFGVIKARQNPMVLTRVQKYIRTPLMVGA